MPFWIMPTIWGAAIIIFIIAELVTYELVSVWMAIGFLVGLILSLIVPINSWWHLQFGLSVLASIALVIATRPLVKKWAKAKQTPFNVDKQIGRKTKLVSAITNEEFGSIQINDVLWRVTADKPIEQGKTIEIIQISGSKFIVKESSDE